MPQSALVRWFCRVYLVMLYAYPREFRLQFGGEMRQVFRDRCRYLARTPGRLRWLRFAFRSATDWLCSAIEERSMPLRQMTFQDYRRKAAQAALSVWRAGRRTEPRGLVAEWAMTLVVFLFATTTLVQAYVVPTGSMEGTVRVGDHMLVDRVAYSESGAWGSRLLPYRAKATTLATHRPKSGVQAHSHSN